MTEKMLMSTMSWMIGTAARLSTSLLSPTKNETAERTSTGSRP